MKLKFLNPYNYYNYILKKFKKINRLKKQRKKISRKFLFKNLKKISSPEELLIFHFEKISEKEHINKEMFELLLTHFSKKSLHILETGSSGTHGSGSSTLFASYVTLFGGTFNTVDINPKIRESFEFFESEKVKFHVENSLSFIKKMKSSDIEKLDIIYLDSFDLNMKNPEPSENHGLQEFLLLNEKIKKGALISIDDTPDSFDKFSLTEKNILNYIPGKGRLVIQYLKKNPGRYKILYHNYALVLEKL